MRVHLLGCGTSSGVPRIGNDWGVCDPAEPRNRRSRAAVLVEAGGQTVLIDTGPDLRNQLLAADVARLDAVIWTHDHADHTHGIDDLRQVYHARGRPVDSFARPATLASLKGRFGYSFQGKDSYPPAVIGHELPDRLNINGVGIRVVDLPHGTVTSAGLRFDWGGASFAYSTDLSDLTDDAAGLFYGVDLWIVDAMRRRPHPTHPHLAMVLDWIERVAPRHAVLTHMDQSMDYRTLEAELPQGVEPGYDGMVIDL